MVRGNDRGLIVALGKWGTRQPGVQAVSNFSDHLCQKNDVCGPRIVEVRDIFVVLRKKVSGEEVGQKVRLTASQETLLGVS